MVIVGEREYGEWIPEFAINPCAECNTEPGDGVRVGDRRLLTLFDVDCDDAEFDGGCGGGGTGWVCNT